jgi:hypothetical protein
MMLCGRIKMLYKASFLFSLFFISATLGGQDFRFRITDQKTESPVGYANIAIKGTKTGTVADNEGYFIFKKEQLDGDDTLKISMIGYEPASIPFREIKSFPEKPIRIIPKTYDLAEVNVVYPKGRETTLGYPVTSNALRSGFADNSLGSELGVRVIAKKRMKIKDIHLNVGICTYDSVTYRLNIYSTDGFSWVNVLNKPVYISFRKEDIVKPVNIDLSQYSIIIDGETIVALELYRDMGEGRLLFLTQFFTGTTYHRKTKEDIWTEASGQVGIYIHCQKLK